MTDKQAALRADFFRADSELQEAEMEFFAYAARDGSLVVWERLTMLYQRVVFRRSVRQRALLKYISSFGSKQLSVFDSDLRGDGS